MAKPDRLAEVNHCRDKAGRTSEVLNEALRQAGFARGVSAFRDETRVEGRGTPLAAIVRNLNREEIRRRLEYNFSRLPLKLRDQLGYLVPILNAFCFDDFYSGAGDMSALEYLGLNCILASPGAFDGLPGEMAGHVVKVGELIRLLVAMDVIKMCSDKNEYVYLTKKADPWLSVT